MLLRKAVIQDLSAIYDVRQSVAENRLFETFQDFVNIATPFVDEGLCWVCVETDTDPSKDRTRGTMLGFGASDPETGAIEVLYVRPEMEGRGIGKALLRKCCDDLLLRGHRKAWLTTSVGTRAEGFYERLGWRRTKSSNEREAVFAKSLLR